MSNSIYVSYFSRGPIFSDGPQDDTRSFPLELHDVQYLALERAEQALELYKAKVALTNALDLIRQIQQALNTRDTGRNLVASARAARSAELKLARLGRLDDSQQHDNELAPDL